jgi:hypothetical protein
MAITAQSIIRRVVETLQDVNSVRWPVAELVRYLNDGQREVVLYRPDAMVTNTSLTLAAGSRQALPSNGSKLIEVIRNTGGNKRVIRMTSRHILDAQSPEWHSLTGVTEILNYTYDPRDPRVFYVYPPAASSGASVEMVYSAYPTDLTEPAAGQTYSAVTGNLSVPDIYANALTNYVLYRSYTKDAEYAGNEAKAAAYYEVFKAGLTVEASATATVSPKE